MGFNLSQTNDEAAVITGVGAFLSAVLFAHMAPVQAAESAALVALGVLGYTGYTSPAAAPKA